MPTDPNADPITGPDPEEKQGNSPQIGETTFLTGAKLTLAMAGVTVIMLLAMLDISIISTVSLARPRR